MQNISFKVLKDMNEVFREVQTENNLTVTKKVGDIVDVNTWMIILNNIISNVKFTVKNNLEYGKYK